jgi:hypothetical protein
VGQRRRIQLRFKTFSKLVPADGDVAAESADISQTGAKNPAGRGYGHADEVADGLDGRFDE